MSKLPPLKIKNDDTPAQTDFVVTDEPDDCIAFSILNPAGPMDSRFESLILNGAEVGEVYQWLGWWLARQHEREIKTGDPLTSRPPNPRHVSLSRYPSA